MENEVNIPVESESVEQHVDIVVEEPKTAPSLAAAIDDSIEDQVAAIEPDMPAEEPQEAA